MLNLPQLIHPYLLRLVNPPLLNLDTIIYGKIIPQDVFGDEDNQLTWNQFKKEGEQFICSFAYWLVNQISQMTKDYLAPDSSLQFIEKFMTRAHTEYKRIMNNVEIPFS